MLTKREWRDYSTAKQWVNALGLKSQADWIEFTQTAQMPNDIPNNPWKVYKDKWEGWAAWLGVNAS